MHFKNAFPVTSCVQISSSYFGTLVSPEHEYDWMTEAITLFMSEQEMKANGKMELIVKAVSIIICVWHNIA